MASTMHLTLVLVCLVVSHAHGASRVHRWSYDSDVSPATTSCPSTTSGHTNGNKLPLVHRLSPCSPLAGGGAWKHGKPSVHEILHRDGLRLRYLSQVQAAAAAAPSPSATPASDSGSGMSVPVTQNVTGSIPGVFEYTILAGYGTPAQQLPLNFDVVGISIMRCKPCSSGNGGVPCDVAFDPSKSSSFHSVSCSSPDCGNSCSAATAGGPCTFTFQNNSTSLLSKGTRVTDTLTLSPSATYHNFGVGCLQVDNIYTDRVRMAVGNIDLSRSRHSLATRVLKSSPPGTAAFSYCLPADTDTHGFLNIAPSLSDYSGLAGVKYVPLVTNPNGANFYYVDLVGITINDKHDLPIPPAQFRGHGTMLDSQTAFTYLKPPIYAALRQEFRKYMVQYQPVPAFAGLDTCYNFTGIFELYFPSITFRFGNGETMELDVRQFMYFFRDHLTDDFPFGCLAFAAVPDGFPSNYLGTQVQRTKEIVYDVRGGKVAFVPSRCGLR